jgi:dCMP deaminase
MTLAQAVATRATCDRKHVGAVFVRNNRILATGYNGSMPEMDHCDDIGHMMVEGSCLRTTHAEQNAICQAAENGVTLKGATAYITCEPCWTCFKLLITCGVKKIVYEELYGSEEQLLKDKKLETVKRLGIRYEQICR